METYVFEGPTKIRKSPISLSTTSSTAQPAHLEIHAGLSTRVLSEHLAKRYTYIKDLLICHHSNTQGFYLKRSELTKFSMSLKFDRSLSSFHQSAISVRSFSDGKVVTFHDTLTGQISRWHNVHSFVHTTRIGFSILLEFVIIPFIHFGMAMQIGILTKQKHLWHWQSFERNESAILNKQSLHKSFVTFDKFIHIKV